MKKERNFVFLLLIAFVWVSCKGKSQSLKDSLPPAVTDMVSIKKLLINKVWTVADVSAISGSYESKFGKKEDSSQTVIAPKVESLSWYSKRNFKDTSDFRIKFEKETYDKYKKISMNFTNDSTLVATGMEATNHIYTITDVVEEKEAKGIRLKMTYTTEAKQMGMNKFTATYYILGVNTKYLYVLSPNKVNGEKVVFLLASN